MPGRRRASLDGATVPAHHHPCFSTCSRFVRRSAPPTPRFERAGAACRRDVPGVARVLGMIRLVLRIGSCHRGRLAGGRWCIGGMPQTTAGSIPPPLGADRPRGRRGDVGTRLAPRLRAHERRVQARKSTSQASPSARQSKYALPFS